MVFRDNRRPCPRCARGLDESRTELGHRFERCASCNGNWVDSNTLRILFEAMRPGQGLPTMQEREDGDPARLTCPVCTTVMKRMRVQDLDLDVCDRHGVWFDGVELQQTLYRFAVED